mmetsp:Transcript_23607/g.47346  ORF Transcript_23607/g.47346 Transcript_23607/m.47346 type:complete len:110 (+) Transcript_23607:3-332(+)
MSKIAAKSKESRIEKTRPLTAEDKAKINAAALKIASGMHEESPMSDDVRREMARIHHSGTSWNALWGDASSLSGANRAKFQYLAGKPGAFSQGGEDDPSKDPFGSNFHY